VPSPLPALDDPLQALSWLHACSRPVRARPVNPGRAWQNLNLWIFRCFHWFPMIVFQYFSLFFNDVHWFSLFFHRCSMVVIDFSLMFIDFQRLLLMLHLFSLILIDFHRCFNEFLWCSLIFISSNIKLLWCYNIIIVYYYIIII